MTVKVIHILTHSLSPQGVSDPRYALDEGWHIIVAREILKRTSEYQIEGWRPEKSLKEAYFREDNNLRYRFFPSIQLKPYSLEWSSSLIRELRKTLSKGPTILHLHGVYNPITLAIALRYGGNPIIAQQHGDESPFYHLSQAWNSRRVKGILGYLPLCLTEGLVERRALRKVAHAFVLNKAARERLAKRIGAERVEVQSMGVDFQQFKKMDRIESRKALGLNQGDKYLLYVGTFQKTKGVAHLVSSLPLVHRYFPGATLILAGDGYQRQELESMAKRLGIENEVRFLGWVERGSPMLPLLYNAADVCVLPSIAEGLGLAAVEALACEATFVGTRVGGIPEVAEAFRSGVLVEPGSSDQLAEALIDCLSQNRPPEVNRLNGERLYSWDTIIEHTLQIYRNLAGSYFRR
ncbi:MAG: glycosyltransferase family 4 protein [Chloroflexi bacterium]|nr:glycosyltransferase family 4 protein [Chloroflexota bacterium]